MCYTGLPQNPPAQLSEQHSALLLHTSPNARQPDVVVVVVEVVLVEVVVVVGSGGIVVVVDVVDVVVLVVDVVVVLVVVVEQKLNPVTVNPPPTETTQSITSVSFTQLGFGGSST